MSLSTSDYAYMSQLHYLVDKFDTEKATKKINNKLRKKGLTDYEVKHLDRGVLQYKNTKDNSNVYSVKGTNPLNIKDLVSDFRLGLGFSKNDKQFQNRKNELKRLYRDNTGSNTMIGHSLGASITTNAMVRSKSLRDNTNKVVNFNTGYTSLFNAELNKNLNKQDKAELNKKITHNHTMLDVISESLNLGAIGKVKSKLLVTENPLSLHSLISYIEG
jgi:hypothetical protein